MKNVKPGMKKTKTVLSLPEKCEEASIEEEDSDDAKLTDGDTTSTEQNKKNQKIFENTDIYYLLLLKIYCCMGLFKWIIISYFFQLMKFNSFFNLQYSSYMDVSLTDLDATILLCSCKTSLLRAKGNKTFHSFLSLHYLSNEALVAQKILNASYFVTILLSIVA